MNLLIWPDGRLPYVGSIWSQDSRSNWSHFLFLFLSVTYSFFVFCWFPLCFYFVQICAIHLIIWFWWHKIIDFESLVGVNFTSCSSFFLTTFLLHPYRRVLMELLAILSTASAILVETMNGLIVINRLQNIGWKRCLLYLVIMMKLGTRNMWNRIIWGIEVTLAGWWLM